MTEPQWSPAKEAVVLAAILACKEVIACRKHGDACVQTHGWCLLHEAVWALEASEQPKRFKLRGSIIVDEQSQPNRHGGLDGYQVGPALVDLLNSLAEQAEGK